MLQNDCYNLYISSCCEDGGIYHALLMSDGNIKILEKTNANRPMYTILHENRLYALLREPFESSNDSGLISYEMGDNGVLGEAGEIISTKGKIACHLCAAENDIYAVNYTSGSVIYFPDKLEIHQGKGINPKRQECAHTHCAILSPDRKYVLITDLGTDKIYVYDRKLQLVSTVDAIKGSGPRHIIFSDDGKYVFCINELSSTLALYKYNNGKLEYVEEKSALPQGYTGESIAAAIRCIGNTIYVSNRGHDSIASFKFENEHLELQKIFSCGGKSPRDFDVIGNYIVCTNEKSDSVTVLDCDGELVHVCDDIKAPLCVTFFKTEE